MFKVPDTIDKTLVDVALGFDNAKDYLENNSPYFGSTVGRVANRIAKGRFKIGAQSFQLNVNNGPNHLHGGQKGFNVANWESHVAFDNSSVTFTHLSPDGDEHYPGHLIVSAKYALDQDGSLQISYKAMSSKATPINIANHVYVNLGGHASGAKVMKDHLVQINANHFTPVDNVIIPTGEVKDVGGSAFDLRSGFKALSKHTHALVSLPFRIAKRLGPALEAVPVFDQDHPGFDHNFVIHRVNAGLNFVARLEYGHRFMEVMSNQPGVQFYTGNFLPRINSNDAPVKGKDDTDYHQFGGVCLETQLYPDAINKPSFGLKSVWNPGQVYQHHVVYKFGTFVNRSSPWFS